MPKGPNEEEEVIVEDVVDGEAAPDGTQDVDLEAADADAAEEARLAKLDRKAQNEAFAAMRREAADAKKERDELKKKISQYEERKPEPAQQQQPIPQNNQARPHIGGVPIPQTDQEWDAFVKKDWKAAVDMRSMLRAQEAQTAYRTQENNARILEDTKQKVLKLHPELDDMNSEKARFFNMVLDRTPEYTRMSKGPLYAMRDMEELMREHGYTPEQIFNTAKVSTSNEASRVSRTSLTAGGRTPERSTKTIQLSKEDVEFCKIHDLDPKEYARERMKTDSQRKGAQL